MESDLWNYLFHDLIENYWFIENVITVIFCLNELLDVEEISQKRIVHRNGFLG